MAPTVALTGKSKARANESSAAISSGTLSLILGLVLGVLGLIIIATLLFLYRDKIFGSDVNKQDSSYNIDFSDVETNPNFFGRISSVKSPKRKSAAPQFGDHYATGIFNDGGKLFVEENPTSDRLTLSMNHWEGRHTEQGNVETGFNPTSPTTTTT